MMMMTSLTPTRILTLASTPLILLFSIPLSLFALFTTSVALATLLVRISIVYLELLLAILTSFLPAPPPLLHHPTAHPTKTVYPTKTTTSTSSPTYGPVRHHARRRTSSSSSTTSLHTSTTTNTNHQQQQHTPANHPARPASAAAAAANQAHPPGQLYKPPSLASLLGTTTPRDYESVGGWRLTSADSDDDALWTGINRRLELPALTVPSPNALVRSAPPDGVLPGQQQQPAGGRTGAPTPGAWHHRTFTGGGEGVRSRRGSQGNIGNWFLPQQHQKESQGSPPELSGGSPVSRRRSRGGGGGGLGGGSTAGNGKSGTSSPEEYFGRTDVMGRLRDLAGLGMTAAGSNGGDGEARSSVDGSRVHSRRSSVSLVKVRGD